MQNHSTSTQVAVVAQAHVPQFDLTNHFHLSMRRQMADVYAKHANALERELLYAATNYRGMGQGLERVALFVLCDPELVALCCSLNCAMNDLLDMHHSKGTV